MKVRRITLSYHVIFMSGLSKIGRNEKCPNCPRRDKGDIFRENGETFACLDLIMIAIDDHSNANWTGSGTQPHCRSAVLVTGLPILQALVYLYPRYG